MLKVLVVLWLVYLVSVISRWVGHGVDWAFLSVASAILCLTGFLVLGSFSLASYLGLKEPYQDDAEQNWMLSSVYIATLLAGFAFFK